LFRLALLLFVFIFTDMKLRSILLLSAGLLLMGTVGFASDGEKITKECSYEVGDLAYDVTSYEFKACEFDASSMIVVSHNFEYTFVSRESFVAGYAEGPVDVGKNISNEFSTLASTITIYKRNLDYPDVNYWLRYKKELNFKLINTLNSKAPECTNRYNC
jgi:hypothetical protein